MRRLYKIILILIVCLILTIIIYNITKSNSISYLALGDGVASGETAYNIDGISFNNYFQENTENIKNYNDYFSNKNEKVETLLDKIQKNTKYKNIYFKQLIHNANIITLAIGMDEIVKYAFTDKITEEYLNSFFHNYEKLIKSLRELNDKKIFIIGLYKSEKINDGNLIIINSTISNLAEKYNCIYIDINPLLEEKYFLKENSYYFSYKAHYKIYQMINYTLKEIN